MDPTACLRRIGDATQGAELADACADLRLWLRNGGFPPAWSASLEGTRRYRRWCMRSGITIPVGAMQAAEPKS